MESGSEAWNHKAPRIYYGTRSKESIQHHLCIESGSKHGIHIQSKTLDITSREQFTFKILRRKKKSSIEEIGTNLL